MSERAEVGMPADGLEVFSAEADYPRGT